MTVAEPHENFGRARTLRVSARPTARAYLRFRVRGLTMPVARATLSVRVREGRGAGLRVSRVASKTWRERAIAHAIAPRIAGRALPAKTTRAGRRLTIDVSGLVRGNGILTIALASTRHAVEFWSREAGARGPRLQLEHSTRPPSPGASQPTSADPLPGDAQPSLPIRAAFYYPWFPELWTQAGLHPFTRYRPTLGIYSSADASVVRTHVRGMEHGNIDAAISSWWGPDSREDLRLPLLLAETRAAGSGLKWAVYYEQEGSRDPSPGVIAADLSYIGRYADDPAYLEVAGKPVVFVYADGDGCAMSDRWGQANAAQLFYIVLKVFPGYAACPHQPDDWHQYAPALAADRRAGHSFTVSPGFFKANEPSARLPRDLRRFGQNVRDQVASREPWQLVTTFNEWGEGTAVESAADWESASGYGAYLDVLHGSAP